MRDTHLFFQETEGMASTHFNPYVSTRLDSPSVIALERHIRNSSTVSREIAGETVVVPICRGVGDMDSVFTFNELGTNLWKLLETEQTEEEMALWVTEHFEVSRDQALADIRHFLADLREVGLIHSR